MALRMPKYVVVIIITSVVVLIAVTIVSSNNKWTPAGYDPNKSFQFPKDFLFGVATAAYQIEGASNEDGRTDDIWDHLLRTRPNFTLDGLNAKVACDSYHKYKEDIQMVKNLGVDFYRFSISWSRLLPTGFSNEINEKGKQYYNNVINELLKYGIRPYVTMYHWDLPQRLQDLGGWTNPLMADYFVDYAKLLFDLFGDRVKVWTTFNEPYHTCEFGYGSGVNAPAIQISGIGNYLCAHTVLKAHARVYRMYQTDYKRRQRGTVGITLDTFWYEPTEDSPAAKEVAEMAVEMAIGWYAHPIFSKEGDYPPKMKERIAAMSRAEGFSRSRLPHFTQHEIDEIRGTSDFFGLNHYSTYYAVGDDNIPPTPSYKRDCGFRRKSDPAWVGEFFTKTAPHGLYKLLMWIMEKYDNPPVLITENGYADHGQLDDYDRIDYFKKYMNTVANSITDGCNVIGYAAWSLMDLFEWESGYTLKFGLYHVNFSDPSRPRTPKLSVEVLKDIIEKRVVEF